MKFFLCRHAEAVSGDHLDVERTLTDKGKAQLPVIADFLKSQSDGITTVVCSSDLKRGIDTGESLAEELDADLIQTPLVDPPSNGPDVPEKDIAALWKFVKKVLADADGEVVVVAHGPMVEAFAAYLIGDARIDFSHGGVMRVEGEPGKAIMHWFATPKLMNRAMEKDPDAELDEAISLVDAMLAEAGVQFDIAEKGGSYTYEETLMKRVTEGGSVAGACEPCDENIAAGWIDSEDVYPSGDDGPEFHPNCVCQEEYKISRKRVYD